MKAVIRVVTLAFVALAGVFLTSAQDLGSANKLFGGPKPAPAADKKAPSKKAVTVHNRKPARSTTARIRSTPKLRQKKCPRRRRRLTRRRLEQLSSRSAVVVPVYEAGCIRTC